MTENIVHIAVYMLVYIPIVGTGKNVMLFLAESNIFLLVEKKS